MKKRFTPPRFLPNVLQAISELKEIGGSNSDKIVKHIQQSSNSAAKTRNLSTQIRRALNHATFSGLLKQRAGKFRINRKILDPYRDCSECRRRKRLKKQKRKRRKGRRRGRHHALKANALGLYSDSNNESSPDFSDNDDLPVRKHRRRRRKLKKKPRRRHRRRSIHFSDDKKQSTEDFKNNMIYPDNHNESDNNAPHDRLQCDNPDCLCNVKDENEEIRNDPQA